MKHVFDDFLGLAICVRCRLLEPESDECRAVEPGGFRVLALDEDGNDVEVRDPWDDEDASDQVAPI